MGAQVMLIKNETIGQEHDVNHKNNKTKGHGKRLIDH